MKAKLTLWMDKEIIEFGKRLAARHGTSFSHMVEHILTEFSAGGKASAADTWWEKFEKAHPIGGPANCTLLEDLR